MSCYKYRNIIFVSKDIKTRNFIKKDLSIFSIDEIFERLPNYFQLNITIFSQKILSEYFKSSYEFCIL